MRKWCVLCIFNHTALPAQFLELLRDATMIFAGVVEGGDLDKIGRDYHCTEVIKYEKCD